MVVSRCHHGVLFAARARPHAELAVPLAVKLYSYAPRPRPDDPSLQQASSHAAIAVPRRWSTTSATAAAAATSTKTSGWRPRRPRKLVQASPSSDLIRALEAEGLEEALPWKATGKIDHSYLSPQKLEEWKSRRIRSGNPYRMRAGNGSLEISLQSILAEYMAYSRPSKPSQGVDMAGNDGSPGRVFGHPSQGYLKARGYTVEDVVGWAWILRAETSFQAALRLLVFSNRPSPLPRVPTFIFLFVLRRREMSPSALQLLILHAWDRLESRHNLHWEAVYNKRIAAATALQAIEWSHTASEAHVETNYQPEIDQTISILVIRLLRYARRVLPSALPNIAEILSKHVPARTSRHASNGPALSLKVTTRLTFLFNKVLSLISIRAAKNPFLSVTYQVRAQLILIRRMNEFVPALSVNREAYRAITNLQLAHRKTSQERDWATLKSKGWPPWKEDRLGLDSEKGTEMGISRANRAILSSKEAGYGGMGWEEAAGVLSGWDTDQSPTIQTRSRLLKVSSQQHSEDSRQLLWEARIRATRTIEEAWAGFLAYKDQGLPVSRIVYLAMLQKIAYERKRVNLSAPNQPHNTGEHLGPVSGDMLETEASSTNPRDMVYVPKPPPSFRDFYHKIRSDGVPVNGRLLAFLIMHAETVEDGFEYLANSHIGKQPKSMLLGRSEADRNVLGQLSAHVLPAFIHLLARNATLVLSRASPQAPQQPAIAHALHLMSVALPRYRPPWNELLRGFAHKDVEPLLRHLAVRTFLRNEKEFDSWMLPLWAVDKMKELGLAIGSNGFQWLCVAFENFARAHGRESGGMNLAAMAYGDATDAQLSAAGRLEKRVSRLKALFKEMVSPHLSDDLTFANGWPDLTQKRSSSALSPLLEVPSPATLHAFIRALGMSRDDKGIRDLLRWMSYAYPELQPVINELANGSRMFRTCITAARVFLERSWHRGHDHHDPHEILDEAVEARAIVEAMPEWGGWPSDEEVLDYLRKGNWYF